ncbi:MAG: antitoxin [Desulfomonile tiedjei]|uniref:Antitoxin n=1 Tax=Desulfomonile tiedjei TaxID=2358 RepID=A0A9D6Z4Z5_9BACT|nr:antitoxin [Desulfomonile tiedjei]
MSKLDPEEKEILESYDRDEWQSVSDLKSQSERYQKYADATFKKDKRVNIRMSQKDLVAIQKKALEEGIPYQTLLSSIIHKYVSGRLTEKNA